MTQSGKNLGRHFGDLLRAMADRPAVAIGTRARDGEVDVRSGGRLLADVTRLAVALQPKTVERADLEIAPLRPGVRVLIACEPRVEALALALAAWSIGAVTVHVAPGVSEAHLSTALERMKVDLVVVDDRRALGGLEMAADDAISAADIVILDDPPESPLPGMVGFEQLMDAGGRFRALGLDQFARDVFAVPEHARAAILYWSGQEEIEAAAINHGELIEALAPLPASWAMSRGELLLTTLPLSDRESLLLTLRVLNQGLTLAYAGRGKEADVRNIASVAPHAIITSARSLEAILGNLDKADEDLSMRRALRRSLDWLERKRGAETDSEAAHLALDQLGGWAERGLASMVKKDLGSRLRMVYCAGEAPSEDARALLDAAGVSLAS